MSGVVVLSPQELEQLIERAVVAAMRKLLDGHAEASVGPLTNKERAEMRKRFRAMGHDT